MSSVKVNDQSLELQFQNIYFQLMGFNYQDIDCKLFHKVSKNKVKSQEPPFTSISLAVRIIRAVCSVVEI